MEEKLQKIRIKDIAKLANVSVGTVDRVLHNRGEVTAEKWERVMKIIEELGYTPNLLAKSLASKKVIRIAVLIPKPYNSNNLYWEQPLEGINQAIAELADYNVDIETFRFSTLDEKSFIRQRERILKHRYDGIVFAPSFHEQSVVLHEKCREGGIPVIFIDSTLEGIDATSYFGQNAEQSGYLAAKLMSYVVKKDASILLLSMANKMAITRHLKNREMGFLKYFKGRANGEGIRILSAEIDTTGDQEPENSFERLFRDHPDIEGVFVTNARVHQVAGYIQKKGLPDLFLGGYDLVGKNIFYLKKGIIDFLICQRPEDQGYKSVMAMFNHILAKIPVKRMNYSPIDIVFRENVDYYTNI